MTAIDWEKYEAEERIKLIAKRDRDRHHKLHLDELPTFLEKIDYWRREVFPEKKLAAGSTQYHVADKDSPIDFVLSLKPQTDEEEQCLFDFCVECDRTYLAEQRYPVGKFVYKADKDGPDKVAFYVEPLENRKADLANRLSAATRKRDLLEEELRAVTAAIESVVRTVNGFKDILFDKITYMRHCLATHKQFCFNVKGDRNWSTTATEIATAWDIVHYEAFLKDKLYILDHPELGQLNSLTQSQPPTTSTIEPEEIEDLTTTPPTLLYIRPAAKEALYQDLCEYTHSSDHEAVRLLLYDNVAPQQKIVLTCQVADLVATFKESGAIIAGAPLSKQLPNYFVRNDGGEIVNLSKEYLVKGLARKKKV
jgi:hypothetical protein